MEETGAATTEDRRNPGRLPPLAGDAVIPAPPALRVQGLSKKFGRREVLSGIDLLVRAGEIVAIAGANGAGKTTLIRCVFDLCDHDAGTIEIFGQPAALARARVRTAYVPERFVPPHYLRAGEFVDFFLELSEVRSDPAATRAMFESLELEPAILSRPVRELSKGMTQKLGLAAAFLAAKDINVLDEPMSGLDPAARLAVKAALTRLHAAGRSILFTSHVLTDVEELADRMLVIDRGRVLFDGPPKGLCERYRELQLERAFLACLRAAQVGAQARERSAGVK